MRRVAAAVAALGLAAALAAPAASAGGPGMGRPAIVSVGDSAISGEAGRWAGNTNDAPSNVDALGPTAYADSGAAEAIPGCHRSKASEIAIGGGVLSANLACSGARTSTSPFSSDSNFKPGLDFYDDGAGHIGQAKALQAYAATHNVKAIFVLIGANDYGFAGTVQTCVIDYLLSPSWWPNYCNDDASVASRFTAANQAAITSRVAVAFRNLRTAMRNAGYTDDDSWTLEVQIYAAPVPRGDRFRYGQSGYTRQIVGGCGVWNRDADWANDVAVKAMNNSAIDGAAASGLTNTRLFDMSDALDGHRLCENTVGLLEEQGVPSWTAPGAADKTEWVSQIRTATTIFGPYQLQEDLHPSYWGQKALRNCVRQAYDHGAPRGGRCTSTGGLNARGEPNMILSASAGVSRAGAARGAAGRRAR
jgi:hypothetical protein